MSLRFADAPAGRLEQDRPNRRARHPLAGERWIPLLFASGVLTGLCLFTLAGVWIASGRGPLIAMGPSTVYFPRAASPRVPAAPRSASKPRPAARPTSHASGVTPALVLFVPVPGAPAPPVRVASAAKTEQRPAASAPAPEPQRPEVAPEPRRTAFVVGLQAQDVAAQVKKTVLVKLASLKRQVDADGAPVSVQAGADGEVQVDLDYGSLSGLFRGLPEAEQRAILDQVKREVLACYSARKAAAATAPQMLPEPPPTAIPTPAAVDSADAAAPTVPATATAKSDAPKLSVKLEGHRIILAPA